MQGEIFRNLPAQYRQDFTRFVLLLTGLIWLFVLSMIIVRHEEGDLRWATVKRRLRLNTPRDPKTGETRRKLWLWVIPFLVGIIVWELALTSYVDGLWVSLFPFFRRVFRDIA